jgi:hypothetical protein
MSTSGLSSPLVCPDSTQKFTISELLAPYPLGGIASSTLPIDATTKKISQSALQNYMSQLQSSGKIPSGSGGNPNEQADKDKLFQLGVQQEYCYYESRYLSSMKSFLDLSTSGNTDDVPAAKNFLQASKTLNTKINSMLELLNLLSSSRIDAMGKIKAAVDNTNSRISTATAQVQNQYKLLSADNALMETQKQAMKYTKEKNDAIMNQISLFTIMNAFAIGAIFAIVRST